MSVLVTGGLGFIGARVVLQLLKRDISVIVADLDIEKNKESLEKNIDKIGKHKDLVSYQKLDITDYQNIEQIFKKNKLDCVINLAYGIGTICEENPLLASKINIVGTTSMFEMIVKYKIRRLVFASSETVYGAHQEFYGDKAVTENDYSGINNHFYTSMNNFNLTKCGRITNYGGWKIIWILRRNIRLRRIQFLCYPTSKSHLFLL